MGVCHGAMYYHSTQMIYVFPEMALWKDVCVSVLGPALENISEEPVCDFENLKPLHK